MLQAALTVLFNPSLKIIMMSVKIYYFLNKFSQ